MEVSVIGSSQLKLVKADENLREFGFFNIRSDSNKILIPKSRVCFGQSKNLKNSNFRFGMAIRAARSDVVPAEKNFADENLTLSSLKSVDGLSLFAGLPLDAVSECNAINHEKAITAGLKALKLMGVDGVELSVWWGIVEKDAMGKYNWSGYLAIAEMVQKMGLKLRVVLNFHASHEPKIPLPCWVQRVGEADPNIYFTDRSGQQYNYCLSFAVDHLPIFDNKSPIQVYEDFCESFKSTFSSFIGSTITGITVGLGPHGELRYPSSHLSAKHNNHSGVGEFQCYDKYMLEHLKNHAEDSGNPLWGLGGPHDVPTYDEPSSANTFFKDDGGSWESPYGDFFLSWYSSLLICHGTRMLSLASTIFGETPVSISGKLPFVHSWKKTRSHPLELTAGIYNTVNRDGYEAIVEMFAKNSCRMVLPGMDLSGVHQSGGSIHQSVLGQVKETCRKYGVVISGENISLCRVADGFEEIKGKLSEHDTLVDLFTYQRMGAEFFSPKHFPLFAAFVRAVNQVDLDTDDLPEANRAVKPAHMSSKTLQMHAA